MNRVLGMDVSLNIVAALESPPGNVSMIIHQLTEFKIERAFKLKEC